MTELRAFRYRLPMRPIQMAGHLLSAREGLVLCDAESGRHWGEAAPLVPFSRETLDDVVAEWRSGRDVTLPSLRSAMDAIRLSIASEDRERDLQHEVQVPVNGLVSGSGQEVLDAARQFANRPHRAVKLKVGPRLGSVDHCAAIVRSVRDILRTDQSLRLDANRAWNLNDAIQFGRLLTNIDIEYCEEPIDTPWELETLLAESGLPYALDETLRETDDLALFPQARALVVKPMLDGSRAEILRLAQWGIPLVFSGTFETGIGTLHVARLAHELSPAIPAGLDSYSWLQEDIIVPRLQLEDGLLTLRTVGALRFQLLEELIR